MASANTPESCCNGKKPYSATDAKRIARLMRRRDRGALQHYHCRSCGRWHVGESAGALPDRRREILGKNQHEEDGS